MRPLLATVALLIGLGTALSAEVQIKDGSSAVITLSDNTTVVLRFSVASDGTTTAAGALGRDVWFLPTINGAKSPGPSPVPPPAPEPPGPVPPAGPSLVLITATGSWCAACTQTKAEVIPILQPKMGDRLRILDFATPEARAAFPGSALVPRWVLIRPDGTRETKIGYLTIEQLNAWVGK